MQFSHDERQKQIERYGNGYADLVEALKEFPLEMWKYKPAPTEWSIHEQIVHIADSETNAYIRFRRAIAESGSGVYGYDQDVWANVLDYHSRSTDTALNVTRWVRQSTYEVLKTIPDSVFTNTVIHSDNGVMSLDDVVLSYAEHIPGHVEQMRGVFAAWKKTQP